MIVLIDIDGVLANFMSGFRRAWAERSLPELPPHEAHTGWDLYTCLVDRKDHDHVNSIMCERGFFENLPVMEGAVEAMDHFKKAGHKIYFCSTPWDSNPNCVEEKHRWLHRHFGKEATKNAIFTHDKTIIHGNVLIDDKPEIKGVMIPTFEHILFHQPYNAHVTDRRRLISWKLADRDGFFDLR